MPKIISIQTDTEAEQLRQLRAWIRGYRAGSGDTNLLPGEASLNSLIYEISCARTVSDAELLKILSIVNLDQENPENEEEP